MSEQGRLCKRKRKVREMVERERKRRVSKKERE